MYYAEQIATKQNAEFDSIKLNCRDFRMQNDTGSSVTFISINTLGRIRSSTLNTNPRWIGMKRTMDTGQ